LEVAGAITRANLAFRGLHYYDGHLKAPSFQHREQLAHCGYDRVMEIVKAVEHSGLHVEEVITSGTPVFHCAATYVPFRRSTFAHRASPGTVVFSDVTSLAQLPVEWGTSRRRSSFRLLLVIRGRIYLPATPATKPSPPTPVFPPVPSLVIPTALHSSQVRSISPSKSDQVGAPKLASLYT